MLTRKKMIFSVLIMALVASLAGCGKKGWPETVRDEDVFGFANATGSIDSGCLRARIALTGATYRLAGVSLLVEDMTNGCESCPFMPGARFDLKLDTAQASISENVLKVWFCELREGTKYRFKVIGINEIDNMPLVTTGILP